MTEVNFLRWVLLPMALVVGAIGGEIAFERFTRVASVLRHGGAPAAMQADAPAPASHLASLPNRRDP